MIHLERIETHLRHDELEILRRTCEALGIPPDRWRRVPAMRGFWEIVAARRLIDAYLEAGHTEERARATVAAILQIPAATIETRERRAFEHAYGLTARANGCQSEVPSDRNAA